MAASFNNQTVDIEGCPRLDALPLQTLGDHWKLAKATKATTRMRGLMALSAMPDNYALQIPKCTSVHTFFMRFDLDLIWLDKEGQVVRVDRAVEPRKMKSCMKA